MMLSESLRVDEPATDRRGLGPRPLETAVVYLAAYLFFDWLSNVRPLYALGITPWSPEAGLSLAFLVRYGWRQVPFVMLAVIAGNLFVQHVPVAWLPNAAGALWVGCSFALTGEFIRRIGATGAFATAEQAARLAAACTIGMLVAAVGYVGLHVVAGTLPAADGIGATARYWVGSLNGALTVTPLLLAGREWRIPMSSVRLHGPALLGQLAVVVLALAIVFALPASDQLRFFYLLFVPIVWIALRWRWRGALLAVLVIQAGLLVVAEARIPTARFIDLQFFMLTLTLTALLLGAVVAERSELFQQMARREAEQRALLAVAPDAVLVTDAQGGVRAANEAAARMFGQRARSADKYGATALIPDLRLVPAEGRATVSGRREDGEEFPVEVAWVRLEGAADPGFMVIARDVTSTRRAAEQLRERDAALAGAMRFAVAGELASALAHELNQPITALVSYLRACEILAEPVTRDDARLKETIGKSVHEAIRASEVLHRLRDFYQGGAPKCEPVHVPSLCASVAAAFKDRLRRADASLATRLDPATPVIEADGTHVEIVLHNLLANAIDAVVKRDAGPRRIELHVSRDEGHVVMRVEDSGSGIAANLQPRLFDPFVTDKTGGMGLGLAISQSLVRARGGDLSCGVSPSLGGAAFVVRLPVQLPPDARDG